MRYRVAKHKRGFVAVIYRDDGTRHRVALEATKRLEAEPEAADLVRRIAERKPRNRLTVGQIVEMYLEQSEAIWKDVEGHHWKSGRAHFSAREPAHVSEAVCREFASIDPRRTGSTRKTLSILRAALNWAERKSLIDKAPHIWLPPAPPPKDRRLSREEYERLQNAGRGTNHLFLFLWLARFTAARAGAILSLDWGGCDFERRIIRFGGTGRQKRRAIVPMHPDLAFALIIAKEASETDHVIEFGGKPVKSIKRAFRTACEKAGLDRTVTPHTLRHTAASWMAEASIPMAEIAAVLGHRDSRTTERIYAKFSPDYLQRAVRALG